MDCLGAGALRLDHLLWERHRLPINRVHVSTVVRLGDGLLELGLHLLTGDGGVQIVGQERALYIAPDGFRPFASPSRRLLGRSGHGDYGRGVISWGRHGDVRGVRGRAVGRSGIRGLRGWIRLAKGLADLYWGKRSSWKSTSQRHGHHMYDTKISGGRLTRIRS